MSAIRRKSLLVGDEVTSLKFREFCWVCCLDFAARRGHFANVRSRIIKAFLLGFLITLIGEASFLTEEWFFPSTTIQTAKGIDYLLIIIFGSIFSPSYLVPWKLIGDPIDIRCILVTVVFWAGIVFILLHAAQVMNRIRRTPKGGWKTGPLPKF
jgi:hypothetical protein